MDFKKILSAPIHAGASVLHGGDDHEQEAAKAQVLAMLGQQVGQEQQMVPQETQAPFTLPGLDDSLSEEGQARKADAEANGEQFVPTEDDFKDSGPHGYLHKKGIHDALIEYEKELQANRPHIDYEGITKKRMADLANAPEEHRTNPLFQFALALGNPEHAMELLKTHDIKAHEADTAQNERWQKLLDMKKDALESSIKQSMAEGDARKVISGKWLEQLAQIEKDKATLAGEMQKLGSKNDARIAAIETRGKYALEVATRHANAIITSAGIRSNSAQGVQLQKDQGLIVRQAIKNGKDHAAAIQEGLDYVSEQIDAHPEWKSGAAPATSGGSSAGAGSANPLVNAVNKRRKQ